MLSPASQGALSPLWVVPVGPPPVPSHIYNVTLNSQAPLHSPQPGILLKRFEHL